MCLKYFKLQAKTKKCFEAKFNKATSITKNPAYRRQRISRPMWIIGPIQFWIGCVTFVFSLFFTAKSAKTVKKC